MPLRWWLKDRILQDIIATCGLKLRLFKFLKVEGLPKLGGVSSFLFFPLKVVEK